MEAVLTAAAQNGFAVAAAPGIPGIAAGIPGIVLGMAEGAAPELLGGGAERSSCLTLFMYRWSTWSRPR